MTQIVPYDPVALALGPRSTARARDLPVTASSTTASRAGDLLALVRRGDVSTRAEVSARTGWARSTVAQRVGVLAESGLLRAAGDLPSTGGRPPSALQFNVDAAVVLAAEISSTTLRTALTDLSGGVRGAFRDEISAADGPGTILDIADRRFAELLREQNRSADDLLGVGLGLAGPVEFASGRIVNPPIMPGWDGFEVGRRMRERWGVPALVDNDANMMAVGEHSRYWAEESELLFITVGVGIGCGIVSRGQIQRGAQGAAGDIGHVALPGYDDVVCDCGNVGCLEAVAGSRAIAARLSGSGIPADDGGEVVELVRRGDREAVRLVRESGRLLGRVLAGAVNLLNPSVIVISGDLARAEEHLLAGVREVVYRRSLPLATSHLRIVRSELAERAAVVGAAVTVVEHLLSPVNIGETIDRLTAARGTSATPRLAAAPGR